MKRMRLGAFAVAALAMACGPRHGVTPVPPTARRPGAEGAAAAGPASAAEIAFVRRHERDCGVGRPLDPWTKELLAGVSVVGLGEQTHGSREGNAVRFALARSLVERHGFGVIALEAGYAEALAVDAWVTGGEGDARAALVALQMWIWINDETLELLRWARVENQRRPGAVRIVGLDMQSHDAIARELRKRLERIASPEARALGARLEALSSCGDPGLSGIAGEKRLLAGDPIGLGLLEHLVQCGAQNDPGDAGSAARDRALADNVLGLVGAGTRPPKVVVLAHDHHVARERLGSSPHAPMGEHLAARLGRGYLSVGFLIGSGSFRAQELDPKTGQSSELKELRLDAIAAGSTEDVFTHAMAASDCALVPLHPAAEQIWPGPARRMRVIGASYAPGYESHYWHPVTIARAFDALAFVTQTTPVTRPRP